MFLWRNKKTTDTFWLKKVPYQELCLAAILMKSTSCETLQLVSLHYLLYLTELNKDDISHSSGANFQF